jgi:hypothetical protein
MDSGAGTSLIKKGSLADYLGAPVTTDASSTGYVAKLNAIPFRGYQTIYNEYYRDQNLENAINITKGDGADGYRIDMLT